MESLNEALPGEGEFVLDTTFLAFSIGLLLLYTFMWCRIFSKAGYHSALGLLQLIPVVNVVMLLVLAFGRWPVEKELRNLRRVQKAVHKADKEIYRRAS